MAHDRWSLAGKTVLVTGAAGGIGMAMARLLAARHANLALVDVRGAALQELAAALGRATCWHEADTTQHDQLDAAVSAALTRFGRIDVVVANAGVVTVGSVERVAPQDFDRVIEVDLLGTWRTVRAALPLVIETQGYVLFVSSLAGAVQAPLHAAYNASKAGIRAFANTLRLEVQGLGVDVGVAYLTYTATETGRWAVEHPLMRGLAGLRQMKSAPVQETAALLVRGIERRARTIATPAARLALLAPDVFQLGLESLARRNRWAAAIREHERSYATAGSRQQTDS